MDFEKIKGELKQVNIEELRLDHDNYFEAVIIKEELDKLKGLLESFFGMPAFPSKNGLTQEMRQATSDAGGIMAGQTLYYSDRDADVIFAMLWPWKDGRHITVKIIKK